MSKILFIENYDSFSWNLYHLLAKFVGEDKINFVYQDQFFNVSSKNCAIIISPGPGSPRDVSKLITLVRSYSGKIPILGVCLGHQIIAEAFGAQVIPSGKPMHGFQTQLRFSAKSPLFKGMKNRVKVMRYHSLIVRKSTLKPPLTATAYSDDNYIMALEHISHPTYGVQFHPESFLTRNGEQIIKNFLSVI
jgi:anthranilate synthase/aminodeoxychorismate synthase-like glutamine amidotransferase